MYCVYMCVYRISLTNCVLTFNGTHLEYPLESIGKSYNQQLWFVLGKIFKRPKHLDLAFIWSHVVHTCSVLTICVYIVYCVVYCVYIVYCVYNYCGYIHVVYCVFIVCDCVYMVYIVCVCVTLCIVCRSLVFLNE